MLIQKFVFLRAAYWKYLAAAWLACLAFWAISINQSFTQLSVAQKTHLNHDQLRTVFSQFHGRHPNLQTITTRLAVYDEIFRTVSMYDFLKRYLFQDRCMVYFNHLTLSNPEWSINPHENVHYDRAVFTSFENFKKQKMGEYEKKAKEADQENKEPPKAPTDESIRKSYDDLWKRVHKDEQLLHDFSSHLRIFDKCFLAAQDTVQHRNDTRYVHKQQQFLKSTIAYDPREDEKMDQGTVFTEKLQCSDVESKIFPWLTMEYPKFQRWNGETSYFPGSNYRQHQNRNCFLNDFKNRLNGRGIVMTFSDSFLDEAIRLIRILRHFKNVYPIQVIYHSNLSEETKQAIVKAAREKFRDTPPQDVWFVDVSGTVEKEYLDKFNGFSNKVLATLFNTFEEMILLDADSVILQEPAYFFNLKKYVQSGTMFYKDRAAFQHRQVDETVFFQKLMPSLDDSIVFNLQQPTNYTLDNEFFRGATHYMESGNVVVNRKRHFMQPLMMAVMNFYSPFASRIYGDKELFWLSLALLGDENYAFNDHHAASIGEFTPDAERHKDIGEVKSFRSKELCSNHPSHISDEDDHTLVWFNSGFRFCGNVNKKKMDFEAEFGKKKRYTKFKTMDEFRAFFEAKLHITHAIIPPFDPGHRLAKNNEHEPEAAWAMMHYCMDYTWCAYSSLGGYWKDKDGKTQDNHLEGKVVEFTPEEIKQFEIVGDIWIASTST